MGNKDKLHATKALFEESKILQIENSGNFSVQKPGSYKIVKPSLSFSIASAIYSISS